MQKPIMKVNNNKSRLRGRTEGEHRLASPPTRRPDGSPVQKKNVRGGWTASQLVCDTSYGGCGNNSEFQSQFLGGKRIVWCLKCGLEVASEDVVPLSVDESKYGRGPEHAAVIDKNLGTSRSRAVRNPILKLALNEAKKNPGSYIALGDFKAHQQAYWKLLQWDKPADDRYTREALEILRAKLFGLQHNGRKLPESEVVRIAVSVRKCVKKRTSLQRRELQDIVDTVLKINGLVTL